MSINKRSDFFNTLLGGADLGIGPGRIAGRCRDSQCGSIHRSVQFRNIRSLGNTVGQLADLRQVSNRFQSFREYGILKCWAILIKCISQFKAHARRAEVTICVVNGASRY